MSRPVPVAGQLRLRLRTSILRKIRHNLEYYRYLYRSSSLHSFTIDSGDLVIGEPAIALHEIVLLHKEGCAHCRAAKEKLADTVRKHDTSVYLVIKEADRIPPGTLQVRQVPAVFIDGRFAEGWQVEGFLEAFTKDCGC